jgi:hypothetical protein
LAPAEKLEHRLLESFIGCIGFAATSIGEEIFSPGKILQSVSGSDLPCVLRRLAEVIRGEKMRSCVE